DGAAEARARVAGGPGDAPSLRSPRRLPPGRRRPAAGRAGPGILRALAAADRGGGRSGRQAGPHQRAAASPQRAAVPAALPAGGKSAGEVRRADDARGGRGGAGALARRAERPRPRHREHQVRCPGGQRAARGGRLAPAGARARGRPALGVRLHARRRGSGAPARLLRAAARARRPAPLDRSALHRAGAAGARAGALSRAPRAPALAGRRAGARDRARHHRRAGARLPAGDAGVRGRQLRAPRGPEHPRAGSMREAGAVRAADGELPGQRAGAGGPRRPASEGSGGAPAADARSAGASGRAAQARRAGARRGLLGAGRLRARCPPDRGAAPVNFWWRSQPPLWSAPLVALSAAWRAGAAIDRAVRRPVKLPVAVISVGNLTVGGAGKTPVTLELAARLAARGRKPAVLSRGYGRRSREPVEVSAGTPAEVAGDEPVLLARRGCKVFVGPRRAELASLAMRQGADVLLLDDGLQHHALARDLDVIVADASNPFGNGRLIPAGPLREPVSALRRVRRGLIWLTGCDRTRDPRTAALGGFPAVESAYAAEPDLHGKR